MMLLRLQCVRVLVLMLAVAANLADGVLHTAKQWKLFTYNFLPDAPVNDATFYNPMNVIPTGIAVGYNRIFVATPKLLSGVPSAVNAIPIGDYGEAPVLQAYPDWSFTTSGRKDFNCSDLIIVSTYRMRIDSCNRLWILDAGITRSLEDYERTCPPKILVVDLYTDQVVRRIDFPAEVLRGETLLTNLVVDETTSKSPTCDDPFIYIADTVEPGVIVYDSGRDVTWRVSHPSMFPDPDFAQSEILEQAFILMDGIVGMTFDEKAGLVYYQPLATDCIFSVSKEALRAGPLERLQTLDVKLVGRKSSQGMGLGVSPIDGSLVFSPLSQTAIGAWNPRNAGQQTVLAYDRDRLQFVADMSVARYEPQRLYFVSSKFHRYFLNTLDANEYNGRILYIDLPKGITANVGGSHVVEVPKTPAYTTKSILVPATNYNGNYYHQTQILKRKFLAPNSFVATSLRASPHDEAIKQGARGDLLTTFGRDDAYGSMKASRFCQRRSYLDTLGMLMVQQSSVAAASQSPSYFYA